MTDPTWRHRRIELYPAFGERRWVEVDYAQDPQAEGGLVWRCRDRKSLSQADRDLIVTACWNAVYEERRLIRERGGRR